MPETAAAVGKKKYAQIQKALERAYGKVQVLLKEPLLDQVIFLILREGWDYRKATRALHVLQEEFVDWNELRVSTGGEVRGFLAPLGDRDVDVKIEKIRTLLDHVWTEYNCAHLEFLRDLDLDGRRRFLLASGVVSPAQTQVILQSMEGPEHLIVPQQAVRILGRIGLLPRVHSQSGARKHVLRLLDPADLFAFQAHFVQHGEEICLSKSPRCGECVLLKLCGFKRKVGVVGDA